MKIRKRGKLIDFSEGYSFEQFKEYIKENYSNINVDVVEEKFILDAYESIINWDFTTIESRLKKNILTRFNFKNKSAYSINFWIERGFGEKEYEEFKSLRNPKEIVLSFDKENIYRYTTHKFTKIGILNCNICKKSLEFERFKFNGIDEYEIIKCSNEQCDSNKIKSERTKHKAFLPDELNIEIDKLYENNRLNINHWIRKGLTEEEAKVKITEIQKYATSQVINRNPITKESLKLKGKSEEDINNFYELRSQFNVDFWVNKGLTEEEAKVKITEIQKLNSSKFKQKRIDNPLQYSGITTSQIHYWKNKGLSDEEAKLKLKERQTTFTKEICIEKYGEVDGLIRWQQRQDKWSKSLLENGNLKLGYSKISQHLFFEILNFYKEKDKINIKFALHNGEFMILYDDLNYFISNFYLYDFCDLKNKKIIEFHGDDFHGNPEKYEASNKPHPFNKTITAEELWLKDEDKQQLAIENRYEILTIWESDYKKNKQEIINKCLKFLNLKNG